MFTSDTARGWMKPELIIRLFTVYQFSEGAIFPLGVKSPPTDIFIMFKSLLEVTRGGENKEIVYELVTLRYFLVYFRKIYPKI